MRGLKRSASLYTCAATLLLLRTVSASAQDPAPPDHPYTLHLYTNLMQIPALVVDGDGNPAKHVDTKRFFLSLDSGPKFRPAFVRLQADDPLALTILLDLRGDTLSLLPALREAISALAPAGLRPQDHVSLYALDCKLVRTADDLPARKLLLTSAIDRAADAALPAPRPGHPTPRPGHCKSTGHLTDTIAFVARQLARLPGRRMILLVTDGNDDGGQPWAAVREYAAGESVAVFTLHYVDFGTTSYVSNAQDPLALLSNLTGGLTFKISSPKDVAAAISHMIDLSRSRYILEFHRPTNATAGTHNVQVTLDKSTAHIHAGGATVSLPTAEELANPDALPPSPTVESLGHRHRQPKLAFHAGLATLACQSHHQPLQYQPLVWRP